MNKESGAKQIEIAEPLRVEWSPRVRLLAMFAGWILTFYGVCRRDVKGSITAMAGLGLATSAMPGPARLIRGSTIRKV